MHIHPIEHIDKRLQEIQLMLAAEYDGEEGHVLSKRLTEVSAYMAESGKLLADAEYHLRAKMQGDLAKLVKDMLPNYASSTLQNAFVKSICKEEGQLVTLANRVNASCTHQLEVMRTQLSYQKQLAFQTRG